MVAFEHLALPGGPGIENPLTNNFDYDALHCMRWRPVYFTEVFGR
jgi:hypothetical protein